ncbi:MipA/OmpV family protein [Xanthomonas sp. NCPPB 2654]|uniref:MipA/OmpV family protein n=1 Tax=unclassified Xanthomonas TaxID=2643310 RepID=UPI0021E0ED9C|nr:MULTISPECIES: MipA/OmpV family protein [unclassified Xanthomonas]MDL5366565.1 MipA/OmpV family protein [Xanthomonas sp. NCPPB 2654]UYC21295.1 MipA/OmpV family protein [Xanthomonas sp. CFBP 8443]
MRHEESRRSSPNTSSPRAALGWAGVLSIGLAAALPAGAQEAEVPEAKTSRWGIGLGAAVIDRPYRDYDQETKGLPIVYFENRWTEINAGRFDFKINDSDVLNLRVRARYAMDGYDPEDSDYLQGMQERDDSIWAGAAVTWNSPFAEISAEYLVDVMDKSEGARGRVQAERRFGMGRFGLTPRVAAEWVDDKYVAYYYGVRPEEATLARPAYDGEGTANVELGLRLDYSPAERHTFFVDVAGTQFGDGIKDSPLLEQSRQTRISAGYLFRF